MRVRKVSRTYPVRRDGLHRHGFTIVEFLVVLGVLALLIGLLLPAVQAARESARRMDCLHRQSQLAKAIHTFHQSHGQLPGPTSSIGAGANFDRMLSSWARILPELDQAPLAALVSRVGDNGGLAYPGPPQFQLPDHQQLLTTSLPIVLCPSDQSRPGSNNQRTCLGTTTLGCSRRNQQQRGGPGTFCGINRRVGSSDTFRPAEPLTFSLITDGLSFTAMVSERLIGDLDPDTYSPHRDIFVFQDPGGSWGTPDRLMDACSSRYYSGIDHMSYPGATWFLGGKAYTEYNHVLPPNSDVPDCSFESWTIQNSAVTARSWHPGGVNVTFADGHGRFVSDKIDLALWRALGTREAGEVVSLP